MRLLVLASLVASTALASVAGAQIAPERYYPFEPGDTWTYAVTGASSPNTSTCPDDALIRYNRQEVLRDTVVSGEPYAVAACTSYTPDGSATGRTVVVARPTGRFAVEVLETLQEGGCRILTGFEPGDGYPMVEETDVEVQISGISYTVPATFETFYQTQGSGGGYSSYSMKTIADVGPLAQSRSSGRFGAGSFCSRSRSALVYAQVGGQTYGANPVASGEAPRPEAAFAVTASPSPARGTATVRLTGLPDRPARVEAFDVVGRRVWRGEARTAVRLDVSAWPPGLYVVRATHAGAVATTRLVVAR